MTQPTFTPRRLLDEVRQPIIDAPAADVIDPCAGTGHWYLLATTPFHPRQSNAPQGHRTGARPACDTAKDASSPTPFPDRPGQPVADTWAGEDAESSNLARGGRKPGFGMMGIGIGLLFCILVAVTVVLVLRLP